MTAMGRSMPMKRTTTISLLLPQRRGRELLPVIPPIATIEQAARAISCGTTHSSLQ